MPEPDVALIARQETSNRRPHVGDVLQLIEIAESSLEYDHGEKAELYAAAGVEDYWIVNLADRCVEAHRDPRGGRYQSVESFSAGAEVRPRAFPELALPAALLFPAR